MKKFLFVLSIFAYLQSFAQPQLELEAITGDNTTMTGTSLHFNSADNWRNFNWFANTSDANPNLSLTYQAFDGFDVVYITNLMYFDGDDGEVGIGVLDPEAVLHVQNGDKPQTLIGNAGGDLAYFTVNQPSSASSATGGIARFRDDGSTKFRINESSSTYQVQVFGEGQISGMWNPSDRSLKKEIAPLSNALSKITQLQPKGYHYKHKDESLKYLGLPEEFQFGLIAQELKEVFPNLVRTSTQYGENGEDLGTLDMVNYTGLIPVLLAGMQEQQQIIETQAEEVEQLKSDLEKIEHLEELLSQATYLEERLAKLEDLEAKIATMENAIQQAQANSSNNLSNETPSSVLTLAPKAYLEQNAPNPFQEQTRIRFFVPNDVQQAELQIRNTKGQLLKSFNITEKGEGSVLIQANELPNGNYIYSLLSKGQVLDTKQMILMK